MNRVLMSVLAICVAGTAQAQNTQFLSMDGALFSYEKNRHGVVLKSIEPIDSPLVPAETTARIEVGEVLYLGRSCDAFSEEYGDGSWSWTNGGFIIEFPGLRVAFPGQAIDVAPGNRCRI